MDEKIYKSKGLGRNVSEIFQRASKKKTKDGENKNKKKERKKKLFFVERKNPLIGRCL